jgi:hypothetical protein
MEISPLFVEIAQVAGSAAVVAGTLCGLTYRSLRDRYATKVELAALVTKAELAAYAGEERAWRERHTTDHSEMRVQLARVDARLSASPTVSDLGALRHDLDTVAGSLQALKAALDGFSEILKRTEYLSHLTHEQVFDQGRQR